MVYRCVEVVSSCSERSQCNVEVDGGCAQGYRVMLVVIAVEQYYVFICWICHYR